MNSILSLQSLAPTAFADGEVKCSAVSGVCSVNHSSASYECGGAAEEVGEFI